MSTLQDKLLAAFRTRLETDPQLRREFLASPLGILRRAGVQVSPGTAQQLHLELTRGHPRDLRPTGFHIPPFDMKARR